jgi:hypothetical protein
LICFRVDIRQKKGEGLKSLSFFLPPLERWVHPEGVR